MTEHKYKVGDKVFVDTSCYGNTSGFEGQVVKVTPSGLFDVSHSSGPPLRFNKRGEPTGDNSFHSSHIVDGKRKDKIMHEMVVSKLEREIDKQCGVIMSNGRDVEAMRKAHDIIGHKIILMQHVLEG